MNDRYVQMPRRRKFRSLLRGLVVLSPLVLAGCAGQMPQFKGGLFGKNTLPSAPTTSVTVRIPGEETPRPKPRAGTQAPNIIEGARVEDLGTTSVEDVRLATTPITGAEAGLGKTIASLGDVSQPGFWLKTPLVTQVQSGRVVWADNGNSINVTLEPKSGARSSGSQISLAAMRALGIPLTGLPELLVFARK